MQAKQGSAATASRQWGWKVFSWRKRRCFVDLQVTWPSWQVISMLNEPIIHQRLPQHKRKHHKIKCYPKSSGQDVQDVLLANKLRSQNTSQPLWNCYGCPSNAWSKLGFRLRNACFSVKLFPSHLQNELGQGQGISATTASFIAQGSETVCFAHFWKDSLFVTIGIQFK